MATSQQFDTCIGTGRRSDVLATWSPTTTALIALPRCCLGFATTAPADASFEAAQGSDGMARHGFRVASLSNGVVTTGCCGAADVQYGGRVLVVQTTVANTVAGFRLQLCFRRADN